MACSCLPCFNNDDEDGETENPGPPPAVDRVPSKKETPAPLTETASPVPSHVKTFNFRELAMATKNFRQECLIGEGGFGRVFKGKLKSGETVAVKQLDRNGMQGSKEFEIVVAELCTLEHSNLLNLIGYCADGDQRLLIYEYMSMGSLDKHLFADDPDKTPMDWFTRMKVAAGAAQGLEYLHDTANPPIIFRDLKPSNILLDENYEVKLSDFGNDKLGAGGGNMHPTSRVMGTYGYSAPEYSSGGDLTLKSDIYSFGVVLLELITGKKVMDTNRPNDEQNLVTWAQPIFRDPKRFPDLADPRLDKLFPVKGLNQAVGICAMCLQEEADVRPLVTDLVAALSFLSMPQPIPPPAPEPLSPPPQQKMESANEADNTDEGEEDEGDEDEEEEDDDYSSEEDGSGSNADSADLTEDDGEHGNTSDVNVLQSDQNSSKKIVSTEDITTQDGDENGNTSNVNLLQSNQNSSKKQRIASSSRNASKRRSSSTKRTGSTRRKVTFKEPNPSSKKNVSKKHEPAKDLEVNQKGSNSGSENSGDEKRSSRGKENIEDDH